MKRKIIKIDETKCNGCGDCIPNCHEGALALVDGKARLVKDALCDGLGACLGHCPQNAITIEEREAETFEMPPETHHHEGHACPSAKSMSFEAKSPNKTHEADSALTHWPIQLHLISPQAQHFSKCDLLLAADCTAFSAGNFHADYLAGKKLLIACPKLDSSQSVYLEKIISLIDRAMINTLTVITMEVPCCFGLVQTAMDAVSKATRKIPIKHVVIGIQGQIRKEEWLELKNSK